MRWNWKSWSRLVFRSAKIFTSLDEVLMFRIFVFQFQIPLFLRSINYKLWIVARLYSALRYYALRSLGFWSRFWFQFLLQEGNFVDMFVRLKNVVR